THKAVAVPVFETGALPVRLTLRTLREGFEPSSSLLRRPALVRSSCRNLLHRAGVEPASLRLKGDGSAIELPVLLPQLRNAPGGTRTHSPLLRREPLCSV